MPNSSSRVIRASTLADLVEQRDKHLSQFMEINAKDTFAVLAVIFSVLLGLDKVKGLLHGVQYFEWICGVTIFAVLLLGYGGATIARFHVLKIEQIQERIHQGEVKTTSSDYEIIPTRGLANLAVLVGIMILAIGATGALLLALRSQPAGETEEQVAPSRPLATTSTIHAPGAPVPSQPSLPAQSPARQ